MSTRTYQLVYDRYEPGWYLRYGDGDGTGGEYDRYWDVYDESDANAQAWGSMRLQCDGIEVERWDGREGGPWTAIVSWERGAVIGVEHVRRYTTAGVRALGIDAYETAGGWAWKYTPVVVDGINYRRDTTPAPQVYPRRIDAWRAGLAQLVSIGHPCTPEALAVLEDPTLLRAGS